MSKRKLLKYIYAVGGSNTADFKRGVVKDEGQDSSKLTVFLSNEFRRKSAKRLMSNRDELKQMLMTRTLK